MRVAVVAGSFDPITLGHQWIIQRATEMFDKVHVIVAENPSKRGMFNLLERQTLIYASLAPHILEKVKVDYLDSRVFTVEHARRVGASHIVRGLRNTTDFEYERQLSLINRRITPGIETVYLMPPSELVEISSSMVKSMIGLDGWELIVGQYVSPAVFSALQDKASRV